MAATTKNKYTYIPPAVQQALNQQMQRNMPSNLQKYQNSGARMPFHVERAMAGHLQKNVPKHLQQYSDAYVHQNMVMEGNQTPERPFRASANPAEGFKPVKTGLLFPNKEKKTLSRQYSTADFQPNTSTGDNPNMSPQANPYGVFPDAPQPLSPTPNPTPQQTQPTNAGDPYGFIMNDPPKPPRKSLFSGGSLKIKIALVVGAFIFLIMLMVIAVSFLSSGDKAQTQRYLEITQHQTEFIRLSALGEKRAKSIDTRSYALTSKLSMESSQKSFSAILVKHGIKQKQQNKLLGATKNTKSDAALDEAEKNNRFDETFLKLMESELANYRKELETAGDSASKSEQPAVATAYNQVILLAKGANKNVSPDSAAGAAVKSTPTGEDFIQTEE